jgi:RNA polymerase sigma-70 factor (ECF subfamily)
MIATDLRDAWGPLEGSVRRFVARRVAEDVVDDVVQETLLRVHRSAHAVDDDGSFGGWVYQVARSAVAEHYRRQARSPVSGEETVELPIVVEEDDGEAAREVASWLAAFIETLPEPYREALRLTELEGLTQREAADRVGVSVSGMKSRVQRGRERLREAVVRCCEIGLDARGRVVSCAPRVDGGGPDGCCSG